MPSMSQSGSPPCRALPKSPLRSVSYHGGQTRSMGQSGMTRFSQMQQAQQQMNQNGPIGLGLSQSSHGVPFRLEQQSMMGLANSMHGGSSQGTSLHGDSMHSQHMPSTPNTFGAFPGNVSIASELQSKKPSYDQAGMPQQQNVASLNEAMEKLCESMKRSAMTRSLVKQISGRSLSKSSSGRGTLSRQNSGLGKQRSGRNLMDESSGRSGPIRRMSNSKHHLQHHGRGLYRHDSQQSLGTSNHSMNLHIDGRNVGNF